MAMADADRRRDDGPATCARRDQAVRRLHRGRRPRPDRAAGLVLRPARPVRLRQDHDAADGRRAGGADQPARSCSATRTSPASSPTSARSTRSSRATRCSRTSTSSRTSPSGCAAAASRTSTSRSSEMLDLVELGDVGRPQAGPALRRPAAAGRAGPRADQPPAGAAARRAARRPRPQAAPADADRAQADPDRGRHHLRPRHPRPGGGHDDGRHHRGDERRPDRAARRARRSSTRTPATDVRRQLPRPVQPARRRRSPAAPATTSWSTSHGAALSRCRRPRCRDRRRRRCGSASARRRCPGRPRTSERADGGNQLAGGVGHRRLASSASARSTSCGCRGARS